jgi:hypothetical protein
MDKLLDTIIEGHDKFNIFFKNSFDTFVEECGIVNEIKNRFDNHIAIEIKHIQREIEIVQRETEIVQRETEIVQRETEMIQRETEII